MIRPRVALALLCLSAAACRSQCELDAKSKVEVQSGQLPDVEVKVDPDVKIEPGATTERPVERKVEVEVEVARTVCDDVDFVVERIVLQPPNPPFNARPIERVSLRIVNHGPKAVELRSGTDARFLDESRTVIHADMFGSDWFMPRVVPAKAAVVVELSVAEGAGKRLRTIEAEATPEGDPFTACTVTDDVTMERVPAEGEPAKGEPAKGEPAQEEPA